MPTLRLEAAGYLSAYDKPYFAEQVQKIRRWGLADSFAYHGAVDRHEKIRFLSSLHVFSVPSVYADPKGLSVLEALANGIPVVQPDHGAFPEMIAATGGGLLVKPHSPEPLANELAALLRDEKRQTTARTNRPRGGPQSLPRRRYGRGDARRVRAVLSTRFDFQLIAKLKITMSCLTQGMVIILYVNAYTTNYATKRKHDSS